MPLDQRVHGLQHPVADPRAEPRQDARRVPPDRLRHLDHRHQPARRRLLAPSLALPCRDSSARSPRSRPARPGREPGGPDDAGPAWEPPRPPRLGSVMSSRRAGAERAKRLSRMLAVPLGLRSRHTRRCAKSKLPDASKPPWHGCRSSGNSLDVLRSQAANQPTHAMPGTAHRRPSCRCYSILFYFTLA